MRSGTTATGHETKALSDSRCVFSRCASRHKAKGTDVRRPLEGAVDVSEEDETGYGLRSQRLQTLLQASLRLAPSSRAGRYPPFLVDIMEIVQCPYL